MLKQTRPGYLASYAAHAGISRQAARKQLERAGINFMRPFSWDEVDRLLDSYRHLGRDSYRTRKIRYPE